jgi:hypothetical protein
MENKAKSVQVEFQDLLVQWACKATREFRVKMEKMVNPEFKVFGIY